VSFLKYPPKKKKRGRGRGSIDPPHHEGPRTGRASKKGGRGGGRQPLPEEERKEE